MGAGIRDVFRPFVRTAAFFLEAGGISARGAAFFAFVSASIAFFSFAILDPFRDFDVLSISAAASIFLSALLCEVEAELRRSHEGRASGALSKLFLRLTEPVVLSGILYFIYRKPDVLVGEAAVTLAPWVSLLLAVLLFAALPISGYVRSVERKVGAVEEFPLEERAQRLYLLSIVCVLGLALGDDLYTGILLAGAVLLTLNFYTMVYVKLFERGLPAEVEEEAVPFEERVPSRFSFVDLFKGVLRTPGKVLRILAEREEEKKLGPEEVEVPKKKPIPVKRSEEEMMKYLFNVLVTGEEGEKPVEGAEVMLQHRELKKGYSAKTDGLGKVSFEGILEGDYNITVKAEGFEPLTYERPIYGDSGESFVLKKISRAFMVEVNDRETFAPVGGAKVILEPQEKEGGGAKIETTDASGIARFEELEEGKHLLSVEAEGYGGETVKIDPLRKNHVTILLSTRKKAKRKEKKETREPPDVLALISKIGGGEGVSFEDLVEASGLKESELEKLLEQLMEDGEVYEVEEGTYKRV